MDFVFKALETPSIDFDKFVSMLLNKYPSGKGFGRYFRLEPNWSQTFQMPGYLTNEPYLLQAYFTRGNADQFVEYWTRYGYWDSKGHQGGWTGQGDITLIRKKGTNFFFKPFGDPIAGYSAIDVFAETNKTFETVKLSDWKVTEISFDKFTTATKEKMLEKHFNYNVDTPSLLLQESKYLAGTLFLSDLQDPQNYRTKTGQVEVFKDEVICTISERTFKVPLSDFSHSNFPVILDYSLNGLKSSIIVLQPPTFGSRLIAIGNTKAEFTKERLESICP